jgi:hypothetical protein
MILLKIKQVDDFSSNVLGKIKNKISDDGVALITL